MKTYLIVTITCPDRPGIVQRVTETVVSFSANWEESRMARLGGDFAGIVKISVAAEVAEQLTQALLKLADHETTVAVKATSADPATQPAAFQLLNLQLSGADHEGIVHKVAAYLARQGINVESMETSVAPAPMSASPLFEMTAVIKVPGGAPLHELQDKLRHLGEETGVDIDLSPRTD